MTNLQKQQIKPIIKKPNTATQKKVRFKNSPNIIGNKTKKQGKTKSSKQNKQGMMPQQEMMPQQGKQNNDEESSMNNDNIKPLGSPGMYGVIVLGLFAFAGYIQLSS